MVPDRTAAQSDGRRDASSCAPYRARSAASEAAWPAFVVRCVRLAGVRLVQTIVEYGHGSPGDFVAARDALIPWLAVWLDHPEPIGLDLAEAAQPLADAA